MATFKNFDQLTEAMKRQILEKARSKQSLDILGDLSIDTIYKRVKSGKGVASDTAKEPALTSLAPLKPSYVTFRKTYPLGEFGSPKKSNLTLSGNMLKDMTHEITGPGKLKLKFSSSESTEKSKWASSGDPKRNRSPRPFFNLSKSEVQIVSRTFSRILDNLARLFNK